jgi:hypothetical protein
MGERKRQPGDVRCAGIYGPKHRDEYKIGQQCERYIDPSREFCQAHYVPDERRCVARYSRNNQEGKAGLRCTSYAMKGQTICGLHGGKAAHNRAAAARRLAEERARELVETYGRKIKTTATEALLDEVQWTAGHVAWLRERVQEIEQGELTNSGEQPLIWSRTRRKTGGDDWGETEEATASIWLKLYQQERSHLVRVCAEAIKAGIEERRVRLAEQQGQLVAQVIRAVLDDLNLSAEQLQRVPDIVPRHLRALAS